MHYIPPSLRFINMERNAGPKRSLDSCSYCSMQRPAAMTGKRPSHDLEKEGPAASKQGWLSRVKRRKASLDLGPLHRRCAASQSILSTPVSACLANLTGVGCCRAALSLDLPAVSWTGKDGAERPSLLQAGQDSAAEEVQELRAHAKRLRNALYHKQKKSGLAGVLQDGRRLLSTATSRLSPRVRGLILLNILVSPGFVKFMHAC